MVLRYEAAGGTPVQQRDARLAHRIVISAADKAAGLAKMAPQVFSQDAAGDATCDIGQMTSLLLASVASLPPAGYPAKTLKHWRIKVEAISRLWTTCLTIVSQRTDDQLAALHLSPNGTSRQRGEVIGALHTLRTKHASAAQLAAFEIKETDFERIDAGDQCAPQPRTLLGCTLRITQDPKGHTRCPPSQDEDGPTPLGTCTRLHPNSARVTRDP